MAPTEKTEEVKQSAAAPPHRAKVHGFFSLCIRVDAISKSLSFSLLQKTQSVLGSYEPKK